MRLGVFDHGWWKAASEALAHDACMLPIPTHPSGNPHSSDLAARLTGGSATVDALGDEQADLLVDNGGVGLGFVTKSDQPDQLQLAHEAVARPLCSHFIDPITTTFQGLDWGVVWQALQSRTWTKAVWDRAQVAELQRFGIPSVVHLPMAAINRRYDTSPLDPTKTCNIVSFVGGQNTSFFSANVNVPATHLFAGTLGHAVRADLPGTTFYDLYYGLYGLGEPPNDSDDLGKRATKAFEYFQAKLFFNASLCIRNRDRFVIFLKRHMGDRFNLVGSGWDTRYGLKAAPKFETLEGYLNHFRSVAINLNLVNGNAETGLNMRHFEITAAGGFMLCYDQPELAECFEIGKECVVFRNEKELIDKINYYMAHADERIAIARAGQLRTLSEHLYSHRLTTLLSLAQSQPAEIQFATTNMWDDFRSLVPEADVVLDCGANVGYMARAFRKNYPEAEIYAFEPVSSVYQELQKICEEHQVVPVQKAVSNTDGSADINLTASPEANSLLGFQDGNPCSQWTRVVGKERIEVCTLDRWCVDNNVDANRIDIVKLDVQGAELRALEGASKVLESAKLVHLEVSFVPIYRDCPLFSEVDAFMTKRGFRRHALYPSDQPHNWGDALYAKI